MKIKTSFGLFFLGVIVINLCLVGCSHIAFLNRDKNRNEKGKNAAIENAVPSNQKEVTADDTVSIVNEVPSDAIVSKELTADLICPQLSESVTKQPSQLFAKQYQHARCLEDQRKYSEAIAIYRQLATSTVGRSQTSLNLKALSLYRLSYCYEAIDDNEKMLASLIDVEKQKANLPALSASVEVPARLGIARARMQQIELAQKDFMRARSNIKYFVRGGEQNSGRAQVARVLLQMSQATFQFVSAGKVAAYASALQMAQSLALQANELDPSLQGEVFGQLEAFYSNMYDVIRLENQRDLHAQVLNLVDLGDSLLARETRGAEFYSAWRQKLQNHTYVVQEGLEITQESKDRKQLKIDSVQKLEKVKTR